MKNIILHSTLTLVALSLLSLNATAVEGQAGEGQCERIFGDSPNTVKSSSSIVERPYLRTIFRGNKVEGLLPNRQQVDLRKVWFVNKDIYLAISPGEYDQLVAIRKDVDFYEEEGFSFAISTKHLGKIHDVITHQNGSTYILSTHRKRTKITRVGHASIEDIRYDIGPIMESNFEFETVFDFGKRIPHPKMRITNDNQIEVLSNSESRSRPSTLTSQVFELIADQFNKEKEVFIIDVLQKEVVERRPYSEGESLTPNSYNLQLGFKLNIENFSPTFDTIVNPSQNIPTESINQSVRKLQNQFSDNSSDSVSIFDLRYNESDNEITFIVNFDSSQIFDDGAQKQKMFVVTINNDGATSIEVPHPTSDSGFFVQDVLFNRELSTLQVLYSTMHNSDSHYTYEIRDLKINEGE